MKRKSRTVDRLRQAAPQSQRHLPLVDLLVDTRAELMELAVASGLKVLQQMLEDDRTAACGPRYRHQPDRQASRARTVASEVVLGGRKVQMRRPRVRARRVKDPYTGASLYFTPHVFRHSFATALAPLIGGDAKTGAKIMGHSPQTFMRYIRANDDTARTAIEKMADGLPPLGQPLSTPATVSTLHVVPGGRSSAN